MRLLLLLVLLGEIVAGMSGAGVPSAIAQAAPPRATELLPPPEDTPEEVLQSEIYTDARSAVDGRHLTAAEYVEEGETLRAAVENQPPERLVSPQVREVIRLLKLRKAIRTFIPFF